MSKEKPQDQESKRTYKTYEEFAARFYPGNKVAETRADMGSDFGRTLARELVGKSK